MSDSMRKGLGDQVQEKTTPQSQKSTGEVASENISGVYDKAAGAVQPNSDKSTTQKMGDSTRSNADSAQNEGGSYLDFVKETFSNAADTISGKTEEAKSDNY